MRLQRNPRFRSFSSSKWDSTLNLPRSSLPINQKSVNDSKYLDAVSTASYTHFSNRINCPEFVLIDGPPFANGDLHVGHALNKFLKDSILRVKGLDGHQIKFRPAWDCHGLPIELKALQQIEASKEAKLDPIDIRTMCRKFALDAIKRQKQSMQRWGLMADYENALLTMDPKFEANQLQVLAAMIDKHLIYSAKKPVYYSPSSQTALAEAELIYEDHTSLSGIVQFKLILQNDKINSRLPDKSINVYLPAWTTTPWTLPSNKALAVGKDIVYSLVYSNELNEYIVVARSCIPSLCSKLMHSLDTIVSDFCSGADLEGCKYEALSFDSKVGSTKFNPVILGDFVTDENTGIVHLAPDYGMEDFEACKANGIPPNEVDFMDDFGNYTASSPSHLHGMNIFDSKTNSFILDYLKQTSNYLSSNSYTHRYPYDWRTKKPVIQRATRQWFASIESILPELQNSLERVQFIPEHGKDRMLSMLKSRTDWCISRQRHWGLPIPAIIHKHTKTPKLESSIVRNLANLIAADPTGSDIWWTCPLSQLLPKHEEDAAETYTKSFDTLDVWFDSGTVWNNFGGMPADLYLEGSDQYRGWFQSSLITSVAVNGFAPYKNVLTHGFVLDQEGQKMSKSIGNVVDPNEIIKEHGSDVLRLWAVSSNFKVDVNIGADIIKQVAEMKRKIRNTLRFIVGNLNGFDADLQSSRLLNTIDKLMMTKLKQFDESCRASASSYDFPALIQNISKFCTNDLSSFYFEILKDRLYTESIHSSIRQGGQFVLSNILDILLKHLSSVAPILVEEVKTNANEKVLQTSDLDHFSCDLSRLEDIRDVRARFLDCYNRTYKSEMMAKSTFQLDLNIEATDSFWSSKDLEEIFMVAKVNLDVVPTRSSGLSVLNVALSDRFKCPRCWTFNSISDEELCPKCSEQLGFKEFCQRVLVNN